MARSVEDAPTVANRTSTSWRGVVSCALVFLCGLATSWLIAVVNGAFAESPARAVLVTMVCLAALAPVPIGIYVARRRGRVEPLNVALVLALTIGVLVLGIDLFWIIAQVRFPADILIWSESEFVNDLIKLRTGYPLYTDQANNESFIYLPGAQILTYLITAIAGVSDSVPAMRVVQLGFTLAATVFAWDGARRLTRLARPEASHSHTLLWSACAFVLLFLAATNPKSNPYTPLLHNDALAQLVSMAAFWLLLRYAERRRRGDLLALVPVAAMGFVVKQSLLIWGAFILGYLLLFDRPRSGRRVLAFALGAAVCVGVAFGAMYLAWGDPMVYWTFQVLGDRSPSPLRGIEHFVALTAYVAMLVAGGTMLVHDGRRAGIVGLWLVSAALFAVELFTSGIAWMLNHVGPGCLLAAVWFAAATPVWLENASRADLREQWVRSAAVVLATVVLLGAMGVIRVPISPLPPDALRYVRQIEFEFANGHPDRILLDAGSWVYLPHGIVMKDRATNIGDRGYAANGDFSGIVQRLESRAYERILVRGLNEPSFWYDHGMWDVSSGIREAILSNYEVVRTIPSMRRLYPEGIPYLFEEISVLEPRGSGAPAEVPASESADGGAVE